MDTSDSSDMFFFGDFCLDSRGLFRREGGGPFVPVKIGSRALEILKLLVDRAGGLVSKDDILATVWPQIVVEDSNLTVQISALRHLLDHRPIGESYIQTVAGRGYRFVAPVTRSVASTSSVHSTPGFDQYRPQRLSIVVLPFTNLSDNPDQQFFVDGITEDLTTLFVSSPAQLRHISPYRVYLPKQTHRCERNRSRARGPLCAGRKRPSCGKTCPSGGSASRRRHRCASLGRAV